MSQRKLYRNFRDTIHRLREKTDQLILSVLVQLILVSGLVVSEMVMAYKCGQMELVMRVNGRITEHMVRANLFM
jgi:hypothetical protein